MKPSRRRLLQSFAAAPVAAGMVWTEAEAQHAQQHAQAAAKKATAAAPFKPKFFTPHEYATVRLLVDLIIPKDDRSGSATDAGVPEFIDFMMTDRPEWQVPMRGGLRWLDAESRARFQKDFKDVTDAERSALLDDIAYPLKAKPEFSHGVAFFSRFRDLVATGFWTSKMGIADLKYLGNVPNPGWQGCPDACYTHLGVTKA